VARSSVKSRHNFKTTVSPGYKDASAPPAMTSGRLSLRLAHHAPAAGAQCDAAHFVSTRCHAGQQQSGNICATHRQDKSDGLQQQERRPVIAMNIC
jgi:hypothetical protein